MQVPQGTFTGALVETQATHTMTPLTSASARAQCNSSQAILSTHIRLRWEYQRSSKLMIVQNEQHDALISSRRSSLNNHTSIIKINRLLRP